MRDAAKDGLSAVSSHHGVAPETMLAPNHGLIIRLFGDQSQRDGTIILTHPIGLTIIHRHPLRRLLGSALHLNEGFEWRATPIYDE